MRLELVDQRPHPAAPPLEEGILASLVGPAGRADWVANLVLVEDHVMADLNARWYGGEGPTDVLSFSYLETDGPAGPHLPAGEAEAARDLWIALGEQEPEVTAGEIIVAPDFVAGRCRQEGWDLRAEWALLVVHGALHILGWEHGTEEARRAMRAREAALLERQGFAHPLAADGA
jgi:probable rRNA maturation factor